MSPLAFWESMENGKVKVDYLKQLPEEYRAEGEEIVEKLEKQYEQVKTAILWETDNLIKEIGFGNTEDREWRKKLGLRVQKGDLKYPQAVFPVLINGQAAADRVIMKAIRPKANKI